MKYNVGAGVKVIKEGIYNGKTGHITEICIYNENKWRVEFSELIHPGDNNNSFYEDELALLESACDRITPGTNIDVIKGSPGEGIKVEGGEERTFSTGAKKMREFETGATRDTDQNKLDYEGFLSPLVLKRYAEYLNKHRSQADGQLRDSDNWQKGIPKNVYIKSCWRHFMDWWTYHRNPELPPTTQDWDETFEDSMCAVLFNTMGYLHEHLRGKNNEKKNSIS